MTFLMKICQSFKYVFNPLYKNNALEAGVRRIYWHGLPAMDFLSGLTTPVPIYPPKHQCVTLMTRTLSLWSSSMFLCVVSCSVFIGTLMCRFLLEIRTTHRITSYIHALTDSERKLDGGRERGDKEREQLTGREREEDKWREK